MAIASKPSNQSISKLYMKSLPLALAFALSSLQPAIAATVLTTPITSESCTIIRLPNGSTACAPRLTQRRDYAPKAIKLGDTIPTRNEDAAKRLCYHWGGSYVVKNPVYGFDCFRKS